MRLGVVCLVLVACATGGASGQGDLNLPTAGVGPFRKLAAEEVPGVAPFVLDDVAAQYREPAVLGAGDGSVILYAVAKDATSGHDVIVRSRATDGRSFFGTSGDIGHHPPTVLAADKAWEGPSLSGPFALQVSGEILMFYAAAGSIGLARSSSSDGISFTKTDTPVLTPDLSSRWEGGALAAPGAYVLPDGRLRLLYSAGGFVGEAESTDGGAHFTRLGAEPVLVPSPPPAPGSLGPNEKPPFDTSAVGDPCPSTRVTPAGRLQIRVLYTGYDDSGASSIGFASRYGDGSEPLSRQALPVYAVGQDERAPAYLDLGASQLLYVGQSRHVDSTHVHPAVAAGYAPANVSLPTPADFPDAP